MQDNLQRLPLEPCVCKTYFEQSANLSGRGFTRPSLQLVLPAKVADTITAMLIIILN